MWWFLGKVLIFFVGYALGYRQCDHDAAEIISQNSDEIKAIYRQDLERLRIYFEKEVVDLAAGYKESVEAIKEEWTRAAHQAIKNARTGK